jgi:urease accessory protein
MMQNRVRVNCGSDRGRSAARQDQERHLGKLGSRGVAGESTYHSRREIVKISQFFGEAVMRRALLLLALGIFAVPASAHSGEGFAGGFAAGFMHPLSGLDHLLAMAAVGIWGAFLGRPLVWMLPVAFPLVMVVGGVLGIAGVPLPHVEMGIAASVIVLGLAIATAWRAPVWLAVTIVAVFAIFHGHAHGTELPTAAAPEAYAAGFVISTGFIHLTGIAIGLLGKVPHGSRILRTTGAAITVTGLWILAGMPGLQ